MNEIENKKGLSKLTIIILIGVLILIITTVIIVININSNKKANNAPSSSSNASSAQKNTETEQSIDQNTNRLTGIYRVPMKNIYISTPAYQEIEEAYTELFIVQNSRYIAITAARKDTASSVQDAHTKAFEEFKQNIQSYSYVNSLSITKDSTKTINGIDIYRFEGTMNCGHDTVYDAYAVGYSFIMDGIPCEIIGSVIDKNQSESLINEISAVVNEMIKSVRTEE